jgi:parvulin-like peptidyl-prolyl isomerase
MRKYKSIPSVWVCTVVFFLALAVGCSQDDKGARPSPAKETPQSPVIAHVGDRTIGADDIKAYLATRPRSLRSQMGADELQQRVDEIILEEVLFQEALRLGLDQNPEVRRRYRTMLNQKLLDEQINQKEWNRSVTDEELQAYYDQHAAEFNRPAQVRIADIFISVPEGASDRQKAELKQKARTVLADAVSLQGQRAGFVRLVRQYSSPHPLYGKGATDFFDAEGQPLGIDRRLVQAAFELERPGSLTEKVIETPEGFHIIMLIGKRAALNRPLETVKNQLARRIQRDGVETARKTYIDNLKAKAEIKIDQAAVAALQAELAKADQSPAGRSVRMESKDQINVRRPPPLKARP